MTAAWKSRPEALAQTRRRLVGRTGPTGRRPARRGRRPSSIDQRPMGAAQAPMMTRASTPARLAARAKCDDDRASLRRSVSGDLATTANLAEVVSGVPTSGLRRRPAAPRGRAGRRPAGTRGAAATSPRPTPPRKRRSTSSASGTQSDGAARQVDAQVAAVVAEHGDSYAVQVPAVPSVREISSFGASSVPACRNASGTTRLTSHLPPACVDGLTGTSFLPLCR